MSIYEVMFIIGGIVGVGMAGSPRGAQLKRLRRKKEELRKRLISLRQEALEAQVSPEVLDDICKRASG